MMELVLKMTDFVIKMMNFQHGWVDVGTSGE